MPPHRDIAAFQANIEAVFGAKDRARGLAESYMWFIEEVGELGRALRKADPENLREEFSDVLAWLCTLASMSGVDMADAAARYANGCPRCGATPCACARGPDRA